MKAATKGIFFFALTVFSFLFPLVKPVLAENATLKQAADLTYNAKYDQALSLLNGYINSNPDDPLGYLLRGTALDWKQEVGKFSLNDQIVADYEQANKLAFTQWDQDQQNVDRLVNLGNTYMYLAKKWLDLGRKSRSGLILKKAQKHMEEAIKKDPERWDAYLAMGTFNFYAGNLPPGLGFLAGLLGIKGNEAVGIQQLEKAANNPNPLQSDALFLLAYSMGKTKKNYAAANGYLDRLIAKYPDNPHFRFLKGEYTYRQKQDAEALKHFDTYFAMCQARPGGCNRDTQFLANYFSAGAQINLKNFAAAKANVAKAEELNENKYKDRNAFILLFKGQVLKAEGKKDQAKEAFEQAVATPGGNPEAKTKAKQEMGTL